MLSIRIICVGKLKEQFYADAAREYIMRLSGYCRLEVVEVPEHRGAAGGTVSSNLSACISSRAAGAAKDADAQVEIALVKERALIEKNIPSGAKTIALCVEGQEFDSRGLSRYLADCAGRGASRLCFIIGGSHGLHDALKVRTDMKLSMSKMTFPHHLARVMLLEQLYRAFKIAKGGKYHK